MKQMALLSIQVQLFAVSPLLYSSQQIETFVRARKLKWCMWKELHLVVPESLTSKQCIQKIRRWTFFAILIKKCMKSVFPSSFPLLDHRFCCFWAVIPSHLFHRFLSHNKLVSITVSLRETCPNWREPYLREVQIQIFQLDSIQFVSEKKMFKKQQIHTKSI